MLSSAIVLTLLLFLITTLIYLTLHVSSHLPPRRPRPIRRKRPIKPDGHILIVLGSGGHTAEMIILLGDNNGQLLRGFESRTWIISEGDAFSGQRALEVEKVLSTAHPNKTGSEDIITVPRARRIHQSLLTTPITSLKCLYTCLSLLHNNNKSGYPDILLTNGPGTGVIIVFALLILRVLGLGGVNTRIVYVESLARVRRVSFSGRLLMGVVDRFVVQWEGLEGEFLGPLVLDAAISGGGGCGGDGDGSVKGREGAVGSGRVRVEI
ncbi:Alg14-domain-containing protein [Tothia fuscella]|uniref:UDP-N-acetylglucosamine transferase subunit ALG14 n=1 Tax=Tothia fuscella TaxID=1048955 RepID=A0A9P4NUG3_9PEZI|nr:Alg14-domain-containing protein [Tothia fuscella]